MIEQITGNIENNIIKIFVKRETFCSSHVSLLKVVILHAILEKLNTAITGVIIGRTNIKSIKSALAPKNNFNLIGITATVLSMDSIDTETLVANRIKKNTHEILKTRGHKILIIQKLIVGLSVNHKVKSAKANIKKIIIGSKIIEINTINLEAITPLISFTIFNFQLLTIKSIF